MWRNALERRILWIAQRRNCLNILNRKRRQSEHKENRNVETNVRIIREYRCKKSFSAEFERPTFAVSESAWPGEGRGNDGKWQVEEQLAN